MKAKSVELRLFKLDIDSLQPYYILDNILKGIIEEKEDLKQIKEYGYRKELIVNIISYL